MRYSYDWIQSHIEETLPEVQSLTQTIIFHAFEVESVESYGTDTILDIKVLPDRAGDCLSHYGMAREIAGLLNLTLKQPDLGVGLLSKSEGISVELQSDLCKRYMAITMDGVKVAPSPAWLKERLESVGQKSINNVVDITNFILLDTGQPVHAFDAAKVDGGIVVRSAKDNEHMVTLSGEEKSLKEGMVVIADYVGALALGGVKGGKSAEVTDATTSVIIEVATFDATSVRKTSRSLNLITDASKRFENTVSPELVPIAAAQTVSLMQSLAGASVSAYRDVYPKQEQERVVSFATADIARLLGESITPEKIESVLKQYRYSYTADNNSFTLTVPFWRADIIGAHDVAEEVGRVVGYDAIESKPLPQTVAVEHNIVDTNIINIKKYLIQKGFSEVMTYSFRKRGEWYVARGPKDKSALRSNLSDGLKESYDLNRLHIPLLGIPAVKIFEIGTVFLKDHEEVRVATVDNGSFEELPLEQFMQQYAAEINATDSHEDGVVSTHHSPFIMWSQYPFIVRDVAVWLPVGDEVAKASLDSAVRTFAQSAGLLAPAMFDSFEKEGRVSYAYRFIFQSYDRTLTDSEVAEQIAPLTALISAIPGAELR